MNERVERLKNFIQEYGKDYLGFGTKEKIIDSLQKDDEDSLKLWREITAAITENDNWMERTKELGYFYIFIDYDLRRDDTKKFPYFDASHPLGSAVEQIYNIPTLRQIEPRVKNRDIYYR